MGWFPPTVFNDTRSREIASFIWLAAGGKYSGTRSREGEREKERMRGQRESVRDNVWLRKGFGISQKIDIKKH